MQIDIKNIYHIILHSTGSVQITYDPVPGWHDTDSAAKPLIQPMIFFKLYKTKPKAEAQELVSGWYQTFLNRQRQ